MSRLWTGSRQRRRFLSGILIFTFLINTFGSICPIACSAEVEGFRLPTPGQMVALSPAYSPAVLKGIKLDPKNPFRFHFFVDTGDDVSLREKNSSVIARSPAFGGTTKQSQQEQLKQESAKLIKYFLASLTIPEKDLWVTCRLTKKTALSLII